jgi:acetyl-CoA synthetase
MNRFNAELHLKYINEVRDESGRLSKITFNIPEDFNFSYDVIDLLAAQTPNRRAMLWCNQNGAERTFTFADISRVPPQCFQMPALKRATRLCLS